MSNLIFKQLFKNLKDNLTRISSPSTMNKSVKDYKILMETIYKKDDKNHLVWVDCEMTGLDIEKDQLLEIAVIITDNNLNEIDRLGPLALNCDQMTLNSMDDWCKTNHFKTGLTSKCLKSNLTVEMVDNEFANKLNKHSIKGAVLAGNSIYYDNIFIRKYLHKTANLLHYRLLDVSSIKILKERWYPEIQEFNKKNCHEALSDILESIDELNFIKKNLLK